MKTIKLLLCAFALIAVVGVSAPLQARTQISFNIGGFFPLIAQPARTVVVHPYPAPCSQYEEVYVYPNGYQERHIHHVAPRPAARVYHYAPCRYEHYGVSYRHFGGY